MTLIKQNLGAHWVIGMKGKVEDIEQFHNRIYNWGGTNGSIQWMSESFGYFWITMEKLERVMFKYMLNGMSDKLGKKFRGKKGGMKAVAMHRMKTAIANIPVESFMHTAQSQDFYSIGTISAEKLDTDS